MKLYVNDDLKEVTGNPDIDSLLSFVGLTDKRGIAVAVNDQVVTRDRWKDFLLTDNSRVIIITATQGG